MVKKIGWQKYESLLKDQITSPINRLLVDVMTQFGEVDLNNLSEDDPFAENIPSEQVQKTVIGIPESLAADIGLLTNYDCWIGHTTFNVTDEVIADIESIDGVAALKPTGRYGFFVGIAKMFDDTEVRKKIQKKLTKKDQNDERTEKSNG